MIHVSEVVKITEWQNGKGKGVILLEDQIMREKVFLCECTRGNMQCAKKTAWMLYTSNGVSSSGRRQKSVKVKPNKVRENKPKPENLISSSNWSMCPVYVLQYKYTDTNHTWDTIFFYMGEERNTLTKILNRQRQLDVWTTWKNWPVAGYWWRWVSWSCHCRQPLPSSVMSAAALSPSLDVAPQPTGVATPPHPPCDHQVIQSERFNTQ